MTIATPPGLWWRSEEKMDLFDGRDDVYLKVKIVAVAVAENREIVKAMAEKSAHGGVGCDCGCGCGG